MSDVNLTDTEREAMARSRMVSYGDGKGGRLYRHAKFDEWVAVVEQIVADRERAARAAALAPIQALHTHNDWPVTPENLQWAATHEALCRSWIFDVLTGLADVLAAAGVDAAPNETTTEATETQ